MIPWRTVHKWLALLVFAQVLIWIATGVVISYLDAAETSGQVTRRPTEPASPLPAEGTPVSDIADLGQRFSGVREIALQRVQGELVYRVSGDGGTRLLDARTGRPLIIDEPLARALAGNSYRGSGQPVGVSLLGAVVHGFDHEVGDVWQVTYDDPINTRVYLAADDGRLLTHRNDSYDLLRLMLTLHFMDYSGGADFNNGLIILVGAIALALALSGILLLVKALRRGAL